MVVQENGWFQRYKNLVLYFFIVQQLPCYQHYEERKRPTMSDSLSTLGLWVTMEISYADHLKSIAKEAAQKNGYQFRAKKSVSAEQLLTLKSPIRPQLEYY